MKKFTIKDFNRRYPDSEACLDEIKRTRYTDFICPKCERKNMLTKIKGRQQYACPCGYHVAPLKGTVFYQSHIELRTWFFCMYLMVQTRSGMSCMQLMRMTGLSYSACFRMMHVIRDLMNDSDGELLGGNGKIVEIDEMYPGGVRHGKHGMASAKAKGGVQGFVERGGRVRGVVIRSTKATELITNIRANVKPGSSVMTDQLSSYRDLQYAGYPLHWTIDHSKHKYAIGMVSTNTIEGFWGNFRAGLEGVYRHVSLQHLQSYMDEYAWRYSRRKSEIPMFELLLSKVTIDPANHGLS